MRSDPTGRKRGWLNLYNSVSFRGMAETPPHAPGRPGRGVADNRLRGTGRDDACGAEACRAPGAASEEDRA